MSINIITNFKDEFVVKDSTDDILGTFSKKDELIKFLMANHLNVAKFKMVETFFKGLYGYSVNEGVYREPDIVERSKRFNEWMDAIDKLSNTDKEFFKIVNEKLEEILGYKTLNYTKEYQSREYCKAINCEVQKEIDEGKDVKYKCRKCEAWKFHDWLQSEGYNKIVKTK